MVIIAVNDYLNTLLARLNVWVEDCHRSLPVPGSVCVTFRQHRHNIPVAPVWPVTPVAPVGPGVPGRPVAPVDPVAPDTPVHPGVPLEP